jgi:hypothetical protein
MAAKKKNPPKTPARKAGDISSSGKTAAAPPARLREAKRSALNAAARVLGETSQALTCKELIDRMAAQGYWTSPGGKTPHATLYAAILRELKTKGADARFQKTERGKFALAPARAKESQSRP